MKDITFNALRITEQPDGTFSRAIVQHTLDELPPGEVTIKVHYSSLNYKDALSATGNKGVTRQYPHTPGVDAVGTIIDSQHDDWVEGDNVIVTGFDLGMNYDGGFGEYIRVPAHWLVKRPTTLSMQDAMAYGTAGFTAAMCLLRLQSVLKPDTGDIVVTGATGGVGSIAVALLARLGYRVTAITGKTDAHDFLKHLGAQEILGRDAVQDDGRRPLLPTRWVGAVDTVGGDILANILRSCAYGGMVTCCGLVNSSALNLTVMPFILRAVTLCGVSAQNTPMQERQQIWQLLAQDWHLPQLADITQITDLQGLNEVYLPHILQGQVRGRVVVKHS